MDLKYTQENHICNLDNIKPEFDENNEKYIIEVDETDLIPLGIKQEHEPLNDVKLLERGKASNVIKNEITMTEECAIETEDHILHPEISDNIDNNKHNIATEIKQEYDSLNDIQLLERGKDEITMIEECKVDIEEHILTPEILDNINIKYDNATASTDIKSENETKDPKSDDESQTTSDSNLNKVYDSETVDKFYCDMCSYSTSQKGYFTRHKLAHNPTKMFQCKVCQKDFQTKNSINGHTNKCHPGEHQEIIKMFQCNSCDYKTVKKSHLSRHILKHGDTKNLIKYSCSLCDFSTFYKCYLKEHVVRTHDGKKSITCEQCEYSTTTKGNLRKHVKNCHQNRKTRPHKCNQCEFATFRKLHLERHLKTHIIKIKPSIEVLSCSHCDYTTFRKNHLTSHLLTHSTVKPFKCKFCEKNFTQNNGLKIHMNMCHPQHCDSDVKMKIFQCEKCSYSTIRKTCFALHKITHGDPGNKTKYSCPSCEFFTYYKDTIRLHLLKHSGEKPLVCEYCDYSCRRKKNLNLHLRKKHKKLP